MAHIHPRAQKLLWFAVIWAASVAALGVVSELIKLALK